MKLKVIFIIVVAHLVFGFAYFKSIPKCYLNFEGTDKFILGDSERKSFRITTPTEFTIAKDKKVKINLIDSYEAYYESPNGLTNLTIEIELSENKKFKEYILAHYKLISEHHKTDHDDQLKVEKFKIDSVDIYGFTAKSITSKNLGNYAMFPTDKMVVYFRFMPHEDSNLKDINDFSLERNNLIHSYLTHLAKCKEK